MGRPASISDQGTRSHIPHAKTQHSQINIFFKRNYIECGEFENIESIKKTKSALILLLKEG